MESAKERLKGSIQKQDGIDKALENLGQTVKERYRRSQNVG